MTNNILRKEHNGTILITYLQDKRRIRHEVVVRYSDDEETYFSIPVPINFTKPRKKINVEIIFRSQLGVLYTVTKLIDTSLSLNEILFIVRTPQTWEDRESRRSQRKEIKLPVKIQYNDFEFETESFDLSTGGISVYETKDLSNSQKQLPATIILTLNNGDNVVVKGKYLREKEVDFGEYSFLYVYKFTNVPSITSLTLKKLLLNTK